MDAPNRRDAATGLLLYAATLALELPGAYVRATLAMLLWRLIGNPGHAADQVGWLAGLLPIAWSLTAFAWPGHGFWWRVRSGGRRPSEREEEFLDDVFALIGPDADFRFSWFVLDEPTLDAAARGRTLMLTRGLLHSELLAGVLAHELGHLTTLDGRLTEGLSRLVLLPRTTRGEEGEPGLEPIYLERTPGQQVARFLLAPFRIGLHLAAFLATGRLGQLVLGPLWAAHWRRREYAADDQAATLGQAEGLADFLDLHALFFDLPVPFAWLAERSHPPVELRLERLRQGHRPGSTHVVLEMSADL
jgi:Zn-dependent protease with chaperone function